MTCAFLDTRFGQRDRAQLLAGGAKRIDPENPELDEVAAAIRAHAPDALPPPPRQVSLW